MHPEIEKVAESFQAEKLEAARKRSWEAIAAIAGRFEPGMLEANARQVADNTLKELGAERFWHKTHVRFGVNTLKTFSEASLPGVRLQSSDVFFLDIGPVWDGYEGDVGDTFVVGIDPDMHRCSQDARDVFRLVRGRWLETGETGNELYRYAEKRAKEKGWIFNLQGASGHRLSDFPHVLYHRGTMESLDFRPAAQRWVLEVQLRHPTRSFGSFFEDLLD